MHAASHVMYINVNEVICDVCFVQDSYGLDLASSSFL